MDGEALGLDEARAAKARAKELFGRFGVVNGVGLTRLGNRYAVKVNFETEPRADASLPREISGVPVVIQVVGRIHKQAG
jgi:hypothetical protein